MLQNRVTRNSWGVLTLMLALSSPSLRADITAYRDESGRLVYVNSADAEMAGAARNTGAQGAMQILEKRKSRLVGIDEHLKRTAKKHDVDANLVQAMIEVESAWNPRAVSNAGALGLMQLIPETAKRFGVKNPYDASDNISGGVRYLRFLLDKFDGDLTLALAAYNAGENAVVSYGGVPPYEETIGYIDRVRSVYDRLGPDDTNSIGSIYSTVDRDGRLVYVNE